MANIDNLDFLKALNEQIITLEELEELEESSYVIDIEFNGLSGQHYNHKWYSVTLKDDIEIQVYVK